MNHAIAKIAYFVIAFLVLWFAMWWLTSVYIPHEFIGVP